MMFGNWPEFRGQIDAGKLVAIGMATAQRSQYAPDDPDARRAGRADRVEFVERPARAGATPDAIVARLNAEVNRALAAPAVVDAFHKGGIASLSGTPEQLRARSSTTRSRSTRASSARPTSSSKERSTMSLYGTQKFLFAAQPRPGACSERYRDGGATRRAARPLRARRRGARGDRRRRHRQALRARLQRPAADALRARCSACRGPTTSQAMRDGVRKHGPVRAGVYAMTTRARREGRGRTDAAGLRRASAATRPGITGRAHLADADGRRTRSTPQFARARRGAAREPARRARSSSRAEHFANFFMNNMPAYAIGMADHYEGPIEDPRLARHRAGRACRATRRCRGG